jgi:hypothetical protein
MYIYYKTYCWLSTWQYEYDTQTNKHKNQAAAVKISYYTNTLLVRIFVKESMQEKLYTVSLSKLHPAVSHPLNMKPHAQFLTAQISVAMTLHIP